MQFSTIAAFAAAAAVATSAVEGAACNTTVIAQLIASEDVTTCSTDSGYSFTSLATPTDAQITAMCGDEACLAALATLQSLNLGDCTVGTFAIQTDLVTPITSACGDTTGATTTASSGSSSTTATVGSASAADDNTVETEAPATSSSSAADETEAPAASSSGSAEAGSASSGSNAGVAITATSAIAGSVLLAAVMLA